MNSLLSPSFELIFIGLYLQTNMKFLNALYGKYENEQNRKKTGKGQSTTTKTWENARKRKYEEKYRK